MEPALDHVIECAYEIQASPRPLERDGNEVAFLQRRLGQRRCGSASNAFRLRQVVPMPKATRPMQYGPSAYLGLRRSSETALCAAGRHRAAAQELIGTRRAERMSGARHDLQPRTRPELAQRGSGRHRLRVLAVEQQDGYTQIRQAIGRQPAARGDVLARGRLLQKSEPLPCAAPAGDTAKRPRDRHIGRRCRSVVLEAQPRECFRSAMLGSSVSSSNRMPSRASTAR